MTSTSTAPAGAASAPASTRLPWVAGLAEHGERVALVTADEQITYAALAARVETLAGCLAGSRRLVLLEGRNTVETLVGYLAALAAGHVVLLAAAGGSGPAERLTAAYDPDIVLGPSGTVEIRRTEPAHQLHPDLALLLSTSGSTGSAKLVRLSAENLAANAAQIADYLGVRPDDCAATTLPITYTYGLSVLHTHLARGAAVLLTELTVVDECFWRLFHEAGATTFPGVPHTFELLERSGFAERDLPRLRYVTQAGGRMEPGRVRWWAELGQRRGWDLYVMYGQTEATARMAYLPPELAASRPTAVGVPVPGGSIDIEGGEIVYRGPNVMLGYAVGPADLALGRTVEALRTGDLGRITDEGLVEVVGRKARFVKVLGHRVDLDGLECALRNEGCDVRCAGRDGCVIVAACGLGAAPAREALRRRVIRASGVPRGALSVVPVDEHPTLPTGKPDYAALLRLADRRRTVDRRPTVEGPPTVEEPPTGERPLTVTALYAALLHRADVTPDSTFASLGGDSLSYVEVSIRLEELLGQLPASWHVTPVAELERLRESALAATPLTTTERPGTRSRLRWRSLETSVWLRALAILLIVGTHADLFPLQGTANALLVIAGYQLVRFQLTEPDRRARVRRILRGASRVAVPSLAVIWAAHFLGGFYETRNLFLANWVFGAERLGPPWRFWFIEALVVALVAVAALCAWPAFHRLERRHPFGVPVALTTAAFVAFRLPILDLPVPRMHGSALVVLYLFLLGWALARVGTAKQRWFMTVVVVASIGTFSFNPARDGLTIGFVLLMLWRPVTRVPALLVPAIQVLAAASLYIYVAHWQALEVLWRLDIPVLTFAGAVAFGLAFWWAWTGLAGVVRRGWVALVSGLSEKGYAAERASSARKLSVIPPVQ